MNPRVLMIAAAVAAPVLVVLAVSLGRNPHEIRTPMVGRSAPAFSLPDVDTGEEVTLASLRGRPVVVNFWATWCFPCLEEHKTLVAGARALGDEVQFVGVVYDDRQRAVRDFLRQRGQAYPSLLDEDGQVAIAYGVYGVPETFFVNPEGVIAAKYTGMLTPERLVDGVRRAIGRNAP